MTDGSVPDEVRAYVDQYFTRVQDQQLDPAEFTRLTDDMHQKRAADPFVDLAYWEYEAAHGNQNAVAKVDQIRYDLGIKST